MSAATYAIEIEQGATYSLVLTWRDALGALVNVSGAAAVLRAAASKGATPVIEATAANGQISLGGAAGTITVSLPPAVTGALTPGSYRYDLTLTTAGGVATRLLEGMLTVDGRV